MKTGFDLVRFDWAAKRLLRNKSNFVVLEGFLSTLLEEDIHIVRMLESEGNKETCDDKFNRVDMLAENSKGDLIIVEVQNNRELDYFHRMLYGTSKAIVEYIQESDKYSKVKKVYSVNIVYFDLGQGKDYVYHGRTEFKGVHYHDILQLSVHQREQFVYHETGDLFPEYYVLRVDEFDRLAVTPLDEWISFLKTGVISEDMTAKGLPEAREKLRVDHLSVEDRREYVDHMEALRYQRSVIETGWLEGRAEGRVEGKAEGVVEGKNEGLREVARKAKGRGMALEDIVELTGLSREEVVKL